MTDFNRGDIVVVSFVNIGKPEERSNIPNPVYSGIFGVIGRIVKGGGKNAIVSVRLKRHGLQRMYGYKLSVLMKGTDAEFVYGDRALEELQT